MSRIGENLAEIRERMAAACKRAGRPLAEVELLAVSKTFSADAVRQAADFGQTRFAESRWQEAETKIAASPTGLEWHFIGRVQRNKVRKILAVCEVIHGIDSSRLANYVSDVAGDLGLVPRAFLQVNVGGEASKGGFELAELEEEMAGLLVLPHVQWLGLMTIPPAGPNPEAARHWFHELRSLRDRLETRHQTQLPFLSMGMSDDFEVAIEEGATHIRVGSAIFGARDDRNEDPSEA